MEQPRERDEDTGQFLPRGQRKVRVEQFKDHLLATRSAQTGYAYVIAVQRFEEFLDKKGIPLKSAPNGVLDDFVVSLSKMKLSPATIALTIAGVKSYTTWCRNRDPESCIQFMSPKLPKKELKIPFILTTVQLSTYLKQVARLAEPSRTAMLILPFCGLRVTELCTVPLNRLKTDYQDSKGNNWTVFRVLGKGRKERLAPLLKPGEEMLRAYLLSWRKKQHDAQWLFPGKMVERKVKPLSAKTVQAHLRHIRKRMGLPDQLTPHVLRKTCFTSLYRKGVSIETIAWIAGHSSIEMTMKYYISVSPEDVLSELTTAMKGIQ
jgi:site-specific recombinase XerD